jgi:hypothetical protein
MSIIFTGDISPKREIKNKTFEEEAILEVFGGQK